MLVRVLQWVFCFFFFFSSRRRHTRLQGDWSSDVCSSDLGDGYDFVDDTSYTLDFCSGGTTDRSGDGDGYDSNPTDPVSYEFNFFSGCIIGRSAAGNHGLHVAGTIGASGNKGTGGTGVNRTVAIPPGRG